MNLVLVPRAIGGPPLPPFGTSTRIARLDGETMGTTWRVRVVAARREPIEPHRAGAERLLATLIDALSNWQPESALSCFNRSTIGTWQPLPRPLVDVLVAARSVHADSGGAFDPTVARAVSAWGFGPRDMSQPRRLVVPGDVADHRASFGAIEIDESGQRARRHADVTVDLCGIAKGYAVDCVSHLLVARGCPHHLVEIGGELRGAGVKPDGMPWWVALETPPGKGLDDHAERVVAALHGLAIATSGDYRHCFEHDGRRYTHTIDPRTARPVEDAPAAVTVLHADCMQADAQATAITVLGVDRGLHYAASQGLAARIVERTARGMVARHTPGFEAMLA